MADVSIDQLRSIMRLYIQRKYKTQSAFAKAMGISTAHVSAVLAGKKGFPMAWAVLIGAKIELKASIDDQLAEWVKRYDELMKEGV